MTRSRHRRSEGSGEPASLPSWAQRHLDESGTSAGALAPATRHRRAGRAVGARGTVGESPLRGWGVAILSVAAAVTAVPLAISAVANDRSDDPMPTVDTFTAGAPGPLQGAGGAGAEVSSGRGGVADDPATAGVLPLPGAPEVVAPGPVVVPAPLPAAVVRPTTPPAPTTVTPRSAAPTSTATTPTRTTTSSDEDEGRSATPTKGSSTPTKSSDGGGGGNSSSAGGSGSGSGSNSGSSKKQDGPVTGLVKGVGNTLGGVTGSLGL